MGTTCCRLGTASVYLGSRGGGSLSLTCIRVESLDVMFLPPILRR